MASRTILPTDMGISIEDRLRCVTAVCVVSMIHGGLDDGEIRRRVLEIAREVIRALAEDLYQFETHTAIVQRAIDEVLSQSRPGGNPATISVEDSGIASPASLGQTR